MDRIALQEYLELKNEIWLGEGETTVTAEGFPDRMTLDSIEIDGDGNIAFWHDDGDLFWGHTITIEVTLQDGIRHAALYGCRLRRKHASRVLETPNIWPANHFSHLRMCPAAGYTQAANG